MAQVKLQPEALVDCAQRLNTLTIERLANIEETANLLIGRKLNDLDENIERADEDGKEAMISLKKEFESRVSDFQSKFDSLKAEITSENNKNVASLMEYGTYASSSLLQLQE